MHDLMVFSYNVGWYAGWIAIPFCIVAIIIMFTSLDARDSGDNKPAIGSELYVIHSKRAYLSFTAFIIALTIGILGWSVPVPDHDIQIRERTAYQPMPYNDLFRECMNYGSDGDRDRQRRECSTVAANQQVRQLELAGQRIPQRIVRIEYRDREVQVPNNWREIYDTCIGSMRDWSPTGDANMIVRLAELMNQRTAYCTRFASEQVVREHATN